MDIDYLCVSCGFVTETLYDENEDVSREITCSWCGDIAIFMEDEEDKISFWGDDDVG